LYDVINRDGVKTTSGYVCCNNSGKCGCSVACKWLANTTPISLPLHTPSYSGPQQQYLTFTKTDGSTAIVTPDGCNCMPQYTIAIPNITDPNTGEVGYACQLTEVGVADLLSGVNSVIYNTYSLRKDGLIECNGVYTPPTDLGNVVYHGQYPKIIDGRQFWPYTFESGITAWVLNTFDISYYNFLTQRGYTIIQVDNLNVAAPQNVPQEYIVDYDVNYYTF
jgi:hypothetical protein